MIKIKRSLEKSMTSQIAESLWKGNKKFPKNCSKFPSLPVKFSSENNISKINLKSTKQEVESILNETAKTPHRRRARESQADLWV